MIKRITAYMLLAFMTMFIFSGCGFGNTSRNSGGDEVAEIDWLMYSTGPADNDAPVKKYFEDKFGVKFNLWYIERSRWDELLNVRFASGEIPDVFVTMSTSAFSKYAKQDIITELPEETIRKYAPDLAAVVDEYSEDSWKYSKIDNVNYAIPTYNYNNKYDIASVWRVDWLKEVGIDKIPETIEEVEEAFYKFRNEDPNKSGKRDTYAVSDKGLFNSLFGAFGYLPNEMGKGMMWKDRDGVLVCGAVQPEMKEALALFAKWYKDGLIDPEFLTGENTSGHWSNSQAFLNGRIGYTANGMYYHVVEPLAENDAGSAFYSSFKSLQGENAEYAVGVPPRGKDNKGGNYNGGTNTMGGIVFGRQLRDNQEKLHKILGIVNTVNTTKELYDISVFGFENEHWSYDAENDMIVSKPEFRETANLAQIGANNIFSMAGLYPKDWRVNSSGKLAKLRYEWADKNTMYGGIRNELVIDLNSSSRYSSTLERLIEQTYIEIITGEKNINYYDEFVKIWRQSGGSILEQEANEWYREFR